MGRLKRQVPKGKYRLRTTKPVETDRRYPVYLEYTWDGNVIRRKTGVECRAADWNGKGNLGRGELRPSYGNEFKRMNAVLLKRVEKTDADLAEYNESHRGRITADVIRDFLQDKPLTRRDEGRDFAEFALERLKGRYTLRKISYSRYKNGVSALKVFGEFLVSCGLGTHKADGIYLGEVNCEIIQRHIEWRKGVKGNGDATVNHALTPILQACDYACELGYIDKVSNSLLQDMRIAVKPNLSDGEREFDGKALSKAQLQELIEVYGECTEPRRRDFIEMFLFAFHACGLRLTDVMTLQWANIDFKEKVISKVLIKNTKRHKIPLTAAAVAILQLWKKKARRKKFVFDLVGDDFDVNDDEALYKARNNAAKCVDQSLIVVGEQMGLPFTLTMHVARHTFAVLALNGDEGNREPLSMSMVSRLLGHSSTDVTERVYARYLPETMAEEVEGLHLDALLPRLE